jgi:serine/threonine-protein kinase
MRVRDRIFSLLRLFLLFTVLIAVALISAVTTIRLTIHGHQETMPNLAGRSLDAGQRVANGLGLELKIEGKVFNPQYPANSIVSQVPPAGTRIKVGQHVHVLVSLGQPQVKVPDVVGASARAAQITAIQEGLTVGDIAAVHWPDSQVDQVVAQEPPASTTEVHSPALNVLVSLGAPTQSYECPDFVGRPLVEVQPIIQKRGFKIGSTTMVPTTGIPAGNIVSQSPQPGSRIESDAEFSFQVAGPPLAFIPRPTQQPANAEAPAAIPTRPPGATPVSAQHAR